MSLLSVFSRKKADGAKIAMISLYDAPSAKIAAEAGVDALLVGDSMGNVILGFDSTLSVTMEEMLSHTAAVVRGVKSSARPEVPVVADLPIGSYATPALAVQNAVALLRVGAHAVKLEFSPRASPRVDEVIAVLAENGVPVMGHLGYTPQATLLFDSVVQGKSQESAVEYLDWCRSHGEHCGLFAVVLEAVTDEVARAMTRMLPFPTIGIGAGAGCDGQVLVWNDLVGLSEREFRFARHYANTRRIWNDCAAAFVGEVHEGSFPDADHSYFMPDEERKRWRRSPQE
jgi:3-methyl-2-oxobutanoate hydroxymethyltransferase